MAHGSVPNDNLTWSGFLAKVKADPKTQEWENEILTERVAELEKEHDQLSNEVEELRLRMNAFEASPPIHFSGATLERIDKLQTRIDQLEAQPPPVQFPQFRTVQIPPLPMQMFAVPNFMAQSLHNSTFQATEEPPAPVPPKTQPTAEELN